MRRLANFKPKTLFIARLILLTLYLSLFLIFTKPNEVMEFYINCLLWKVACLLSTCSQQNFLLSSILWAQTLLNKIAICVNKTQRDTVDSSFGRETRVSLSYRNDLLLFHEIYRPPIDWVFNHTNLR